MMMWANAQWSNEGLLKMINEKVETLIWKSKIWLAAVKMIDEKVPTLIWNSKIWFAAEGAWDDDVSQCTVVQWGVIGND